MSKHNDEHEFEHMQYEGTTGAGKHVFKGLLIGSLVGAATMLLFAPRTGQETRAEIRGKAMELRDRTTETVKDTVSQAKTKAYELKDTVREKAEEIKQRSKHTVNRQLDQVSQAAENGKQRVQEY